MESGYSSPRADKFPAGLRVLVVDDDPTWLKILEKMLRKCSYEVTTCCLAREALSILRGRKDNFDLVISDVNMPDMDGFKLLERVGLEMDLPVIMMSVDGETSRVMKGVQHGACDYLLKPIRMKELSNIWQHVLRKKIHEAKDTDYYELGNFQLIQNNSDGFHESHLTNRGSFGTLKKRKEVENKKYDDQESLDSSSSKKARVVWTVDLHQKFVDAVNQIDFDKIGPKKILDMMKVPGLTRENVASHLQKFRLYLSRLQKENELKASLHGTKTLDFHTEAPVCFDFQNSFSVDQKSHEGELKGMVSFLPAKKVKKPPSNGSPNHKKSNVHTSHTIQDHEMQFKQHPLKSVQKQDLNDPNSMIKVNHASQLLSIPIPRAGNHTVYDQQCINNFTHVQQKMATWESSFAPSLEENVQFLLQEYGRGENMGYQNCDYNAELVDELQTEFYCESSVFWDKHRDLIESTFVDQGLFIV